jgi:hypothetical protein
VRLAAIAFGEDPALLVGASEEKERRPNRLSGLLRRT